MTKTIIVTGATSGIGLAVTRQFLAKGYQVIGIGSSESSCRRAQNDLNGDGQLSKSTFLAANLVHQHEVMRISQELGSILDKQGGRLDALISNAGCVRSWYATSDEGFEQQFSLNHLAGFRLIHELMPYLARGNGRIILTGSGSHKGVRIKWNDIMLSRRYSPLTAYKQSKLCNMLFALEFNRRYHQRGLGAFVVDPGLVRTNIGNKQTGFLVSLVWSLRKRQGDDPSIPAKTYVNLVERPDRPDFLCWRSSRPQAFGRAVRADDARRLFELSEKLCGIKY